MLSTKLNHTTATNKLILTTIIYILFLVISYFSSILNNFSSNIIQFISIIIFALIIFYNVKTVKLFDFKLKNKNPYIDFLFIGMVILFFAIAVHPIDNIEQIIKLSPLAIFNCLLTALSAGIFEEFLVRLLLFDGIAQLLKKQHYYLLKSAIYSSIIFGLFHLSNLSFQSPNATFQQIFYSVAIGLIFAFIRLRTNGIALCVILHSLVDFQPNIDQSSVSTSWTSLIIIFTPIIIISIWSIFKLNKDYQQIIQ